MYIVYIHVHVQYTHVIHNVIAVQQLTVHVHVHTCSCLLTPLAQCNCKLSSAVCFRGFTLLHGSSCSTPWTLRLQEPVLFSPEPSRWAWPTTTLGWRQTSGVLWRRDFPVGCWVCWCVPPPLLLESTSRPAGEWTGVYPPPPSTLTTGVNLSACWSAQTHPL